MPAGPSAEVPTISVVIPTYRRRALLPHLLESLLGDVAATEIVVVVDGCDDGSYEYLERLAAGEAKLRPFFIPNAGQAGAQRYGAKRARGEVLLFLDDDVVAEPDLVIGHARRHRGGHDLVVLGYMPVAAAPVAGAPGWIVRRYADRYESMTRRWERDPDLILQTMWGGNVSVRACHVRGIPLLNCDAGLSYHVDLEFGIRAWKAGLRGVFDRSLLSQHHYSRTAAQFLRDRAVSAADRRILHQLHADLLGELSHDYFSHDGSAADRAILRIMRGRSGHAERLLARTVHALDRARMYRTQERAADLLDRMQGQRIACGPYAPAGGPALRG